jgi:glycerol kinase
MTRSVGALYLAIDQGGQSTRAFAFDGRGKLVAEGREQCAVSQPRPHWVEQNVDDVVGSVERALTRLMHALGEQRRAIAAAGLATQRSSIACWDRVSGAALSPVISWQDTRAHGWLEQFQPRAAEIERITGLHVSAHYGASKLRWCLDNLTAVQDAHTAGRLAWGPLASLLLFRLLDERPLAVDPANASRTLLWNLGSCDWDRTLLSLFGLPLEALPRCRPSAWPFGTLRYAGCEVPLKLVTGDQSAALYAFGEPQLQTAYVNVGTGAFVQRLSRQQPARAGRYLASMILHDGQELTYALEGTVNGAASALRWFEREYGPADVEAALPQWLVRTGTPPLFLNGVSGLGSPYWVADFTPRFVGDGEPWQQAVAIVESVVFLLQLNMEGMREFTAPPREIRISGGLARLDGLCQRLADVSGVRVYRPAACEATARGTAFLVAGRPRSWRDPEGGRWFDPEVNNALGARYQSWCDAMRVALTAVPS